MALVLIFALLAQDPLQLGRQALAAGRLDEAESHLKSALAANPPRVFQVYFALGRVYLQKRDWVRAKEAFTQCLARAPRFGPALVGRARASLFLEEIDSGLSDLKAAQAVPDPPPEAAVLERELALFLSRGIPASEDELKQTLSQDLGSPDGYLALGAYYFGNGETEKAIQAFGIAQAIDDQNPVLYLFLKGYAEPPAPYPELRYDFQTARATLEKGDGEAASAGARKILGRRPLFVPARLLLIHIAETANRPLDALIEYGQLIERLPELAAVRIQVARLAYRVGAYELAECNALRALDSQPGDAALYYLLANAQLSAGKAEKALETCQRAIARGFATAPTYFTLGEAQHARMEIGESIAALQKAVELDPQAAENIAAFALSSLTTEQYASLRKLLETHVQSHPDNINTLYSLGVMYLRDGDSDKAKAYFERVRALAPKQAQAYYNLALLYQREDRAALAQDALARFRELKEEEERQWLEGHRAHDERLRGKDALARGDFGTAVEIFTELAGRRAHEVADLVSLGESLLGAGHAAEARDAFDGALKQAPYQPDALAGMANALESLGEKEPVQRLRAAASFLKRPCP